jgi:hypothetical protein
MFDRIRQIADKYVPIVPKEEKKEEPVERWMGINPFVNPKRLTDLLRVEANILLTEGRECYGN